MSTQTEIAKHDLNRVMAEILDIEILAGNNNVVTVWFLAEEWAEKGWDEYTIWTPCTDANQMELVEAFLLKEGWFLVSEQYGGLGAKGIVYRIDGENNLPEYYSATDLDKKMAFAKAVNAYWTKRSARHGGGLGGESNAANMRMSPQPSET